MTILPSGSNLNALATPDVVVVEVKPATVIGERAVRVLGMPGDFNWGEELTPITIGSTADLLDKLGTYVEGLNGFLDVYSALRQGCNNIQVVRLVPPEGSAVDAEYTITNTHYTQDDAGNIVRFLALAEGAGGSGITIKITNGSGANKTITINEGEASEEIFPDLDMNEGVPGSYIVDYINANSVLVRVERLSGLTDDTLPTNQLATAMTDTLDVDIITLTAVTTGADGNNTLFSTTDNGDGTFDMILVDLENETSEQYSGLNMILADPDYVVTQLSGSSIATAVREDTNVANLVPKTIDTQYLSGGSDGGLEYATKVCQSALGADIIELKAKYRGTYGNSISVKIVNNSSTFDVYIYDQQGRLQSFKNLTMNPVLPSYALTKINDPTNGSQVITAIRKSGAGTLTLPDNLSVVYLTGGSDGDPVDDAAIQDGIDVFAAEDYIDVLTLGSLSNGTANANAVALRDLCIDRRERIAVLNSPTGATNAQAITFASAVTSEFVVVTHPEQKISNPITGEQPYIACAPSYAGRLATLSFETSPAREIILGCLGLSRTISTVSTNTDTNLLTVGGVSPIGYIKGFGYSIINGINTSTDSTLNQINHISMRGFIARNLSEGLQTFVSGNHTPQYRIQLKNAVSLFLSRLHAEGRIGDPDNPSKEAAFKVVCDASTNPRSVVVAHMVIMEVQVKLLNSADFVVIKLDASGNVTFDY